MNPNRKLQKINEKYSFEFSLDDIVDSRILFYTLAYNIETMINEIKERGYLAGYIAKELLDKKNLLSFKEDTVIQIIGVDFVVRPLANGNFRIEIK